MDSSALGMLTVIAVVSLILLVVQVLVLRRIFKVFTHLSLQKRQVDLLAEIALKSGVAENVVVEILERETKF